MAPIRRVPSYFRRFLESLIFLARVVGSVVTRRPLIVKHLSRRGPTAIVTPQGRFLPQISGAAPDDDEDEEKKKKKDDETDDDDKKKKDDEETEPVETGDDWKTKSRKNETRAKKAERERDEEKKKREEREESEKSDNEKAVDAAKKEGRKEAETAAEKERKADRLEVACTRLAAKKIKVGEGDDAEEVRFADTEDALLHVERAIARGEIDENDIFDDEGKVKSDALQSELADLLSRKPHLRDGGTEGKAAPKGDPDTRKGSPASSDLEAMSPEDHAKRKYGKGEGN